MIRRWRARLRGEEGQSTVEYAAITAAVFGGTVLSWPFLIRLLDAFDTYYRSIYLVISAPLP